MATDDTIWLPAIQNGRWRYNMATNDTKMAAGDIIWSPTIQYGYRLYKMAVGDIKMAISNTKHLKLSSEAQNKHWKWKSRFEKHDSVMSMISQSFKLYNYNFASIYILQICTFYAIIELYGVSIVPQEYYHDVIDHIIITLTCTVIRYRTIPIKHRRLALLRIDFSRLAREVNSYQRPVTEGSCDLEW